MDNRTLGIIYAIKKGDNTARQNIIDFMSKYSDTPKEYYTDYNLIPLIEATFVDYLKTADNPSFDVWQYFDAKGRSRNFQQFYPDRAVEFQKTSEGFGIDTDAIISALALTTVRKDGKYVNGFRDYTEEVQDG